MSVINKIVESRNFTAVNVGKLSSLMQNANGKIFLKE